MNIQKCEREIDHEQEFKSFANEVNGDMWIAGARRIIAGSRSEVRGTLTKARRKLSDELMLHSMLGEPYFGWIISFYGKNSRGYIYQGVRENADAC